jgi:membrane fusion protein (multidrug efflux system)
VKRRVSGLVKKALAAVLLAAFATGGAAYWEHSNHFRATDDSYINADVVQVASLVPGQVVSVHVHENQLVHKGDPLFDVDPQPFQVAIDKAQAQLALAQQGKRQDTADVQAAAAEVARQQADFGNAQAAQRRATDLVGKGFLSRQALDDANAKLAASRAAVEQARAGLAKAQAAVSDAGRQTPAVAAAIANLEQARLDLQHAHVTASQDGRVVNISLAAGTTVTPGQPLFAVIVDRSFWVDANFKETQLDLIRPGQAVDVEVDMYPGHVFHGHVESLGGGTGTAFSLLPPQNATGNWVKVTQRVPVKIRFDDFDPQFPLRVGATATVAVHVS